jgi:hypothetical protein
MHVNAISTEEQKTSQQKQLRLCDADASQARWRYAGMLAQIVSAYKHYQSAVIAWATQSVRKLTGIAAILSQD